MDNIIKIWLFSDTHGNHSQLNVPNVDMAIHAGDSTNFKGNMNYHEAENFYEWYKSLKIKTKLLIGGNHDYSLYTRYHDLNMYKEFTYLEEQTYKFGKNIIYGTPYTPAFNSWYFMTTEEQEFEHVKRIPPCDILITHGPPKFILDTVQLKNPAGMYKHAGSIDLYHRVKKLNPKLHVFGHIHNSVGNKYPENNGVFFNGKTYFVNASCCSDGNMSKISSHGWICTYDLINKKVIEIFKN